MYAGDDGFPETAPVGSFPKGANRWGVQDLQGNVAQWTSTEMPGGLYIVRGTSWLEGSASSLYSSYGVRQCPEHHYDEDLGFRCARSFP
jgi:formylglycine-generating enzyme required for sulfatase activity